MFSPFYYDFLVCFFTILPYLLILVKGMVIASTERTISSFIFAVCFVVVVSAGFSWLQSFTFIGNVLCLFISFGMIPGKGEQ